MGKYQIIRFEIGFGGGLGFTVGAIRWPHVPMFQPHGRKAF